MATAASVVAGLTVLPTYDGVLNEKTSERGDTYDEEPADSVGDIGGVDEPDDSVVWGRIKNVNLGVCMVDGRVHIESNFSSPGVEIGDHKDDSSATASMYTGSVGGNALAKSSGDRQAVAGGLGKSLVSIAGVNCSSPQRVFHMSRLLVHWSAN